MTIETLSLETLLTDLPDDVLTGAIDVLIEPQIRRGLDNPDTAQMAKLLTGCAVLVKTSRRENPAEYTTAIEYLRGVISDGPSLCEASPVDAGDVDDDLNVLESVCRKTRHSLLEQMTLEQFFFNCRIRGAN